MKSEKNRLDLIHEFDIASETTLFPQEIVCAIRACSKATVERDRWAGTGVPFLKVGRSVRYRKADILTWLEHHKTYCSTTEAQNHWEGK